MLLLPQLRLLDIANVLPGRGWRVGPSRIISADRRVAPRVVAVIARVAARIASEISRIASGISGISGISSGPGGDRVSSISGWCLWGRSFGSSRARCVLGLQGRLYPVRREDITDVSERHRVVASRWRRCRPRWLRWDGAARRWGLRGRRVLCSPS